MLADMESMSDMRTTQHGCKATRISHAQARNRLTGDLYPITPVTHRLSLKAREVDSWPLFQAIDS